MPNFLRLWTDVKVEDAMLNDPLVEGLELIDENISMYSVESDGTGERQYGLVSKEDFITLLEKHKPTVVEVNSFQSLFGLEKICKSRGIVMVFATYGENYEFLNYRRN